MKRACPNNRHYIPETAAEGERNSRDEAVEKDGKTVHGASDCPVWKRRAARLFRMGKLYRIPNPIGEFRIQHEWTENCPKTSWNRWGVEVFRLGLVLRVL